MFKRFFSSAVLVLTVLFAPALTALAAGGATEENGAAGSLMEGPFVILAIGTLAVMTYYCIRD
ncbi:hypothetical protein SAMN05421736_11979 [Evansella caseinilytica]|uniref:Uncharacterized protein n=1 Tax=Evansella caseinilytica TaxID=1503961 RepID=A0A1H3U9A2_9BACI|nr:hypothetical protein [Evansella caseinilytica]SDZ58978.1 hypothetical protein SAMN05421736_11979 [Evansella caseinilytica]